MKYLTKFNSFDFDAFMQGKVLEVIAIRENVNYESGEHLGSKVETVIVEDNTDYHITDGKPITNNKYEKIVFKMNKDVVIPIGSKVIPKNAIARVYGEYNNQLSVTCEDIVVIGKEKTHEEK